jgi:hypothetical protein
MYCNQYIEEKKAAKKETITSRTFSIDYISNLITSNNITSYENFQRTLPTQTKIQLLKQLGYVGQNIIKTLIKIHTIEKLQNIKTHHFYDIMIHNFDISKTKQENIEWIQQLFVSNGINIDNFFSDFILIHTTAITKINTLVIEGPTNTGKSLLINLLLSDTHPTRIARERDKSNFHLDQLPNATAVVFEEPIIDQTTIGTWKLLLEGAPIPTDMKHADKEIINRLPIFVTTNHPIWNWVSTEDIAPLQQRMFIYKLTSPISSTITQTSKLPMPPHIITTHDLYAYIIMNIQTIHDKYISSLASTPNADTAKIFSSQHYNKLLTIQNNLLLQDTPQLVPDFSINDE